MKKMKYTIASLACCLLVMMSTLSSCGVGSKAAPPKVNNGAGLSVNDLNKGDLIALLESKDRLVGLQTSGTLKIDADGHNLSTRVNFVLAKGKGIRMIFVPLPFVELGRVWITPKGVTLTDAIHKYYTSFTFAEISDELGVDVDYNALESLFMGRLFTPGETRASAVKVFDLAHENNEPRLSMQNHGTRFTFAISEKALVKWISGYALENKSIGARWEYSAYDAQGLGTAFPFKQSIFINRGGAKSKPYRATFVLNQPDEVSVPESSVFEPNIKDGYTKLTKEDLKKMIKKLL